MAFATIDDLEAYMRADLSGNVASAQFALDVATAFVQGWTGQQIEHVEDDVATVVPKGMVVLLPQLPVVGVSAVTSDGDPVSWASFPGGVLELRDSWTDSVTVTYTHGYETIPTAIVAATVQEAARIYRSSEQAAAGVRSETESIDDYSRSVTYMEGGGEVGGGMMLEGTRHLLAPYRHRSLV